MTGALSALLRGRVPWLLWALPALGIARLVPGTGGGLYLRLLAATACLLVPGALIARALRVRGSSAVVAWSLGVLFAATAVMFALRSSLTLALILLAVIAATAGIAVAVRPSNNLLQGDRRPERVAGRWVPFAVAAAGLGLGIALWLVMRHLTGGDDLFHLARVRKLDGFGDLTLRSVDEFSDGGLHPGYAFPLWHAFLALVARLGGVDPTDVVLHEASVLVPVAFVVAWEAGAAVFRSAWGGISVLLAQVAMFALAAGSGGAYTSLALPATAGRQLLVPVVLALFFAYVERRSWAGLALIAVAGLGLALVHPTYALFVAIPLGGYVVARALLARTELASGAAALGAVLAPTAGVALWLRPIASETASVSPSAVEVQRALGHYRGQLDVFSDDRYRLAPEVLGRSGAVAVAALLLVPLAVLAAKRRWAALVLGGFVGVLALMLVPELFTRLSDVVSLSQARRAAGFVPFAFAVAGGAALLARLLSVGALPVALAVGIAFQLSYPGDFAYNLRQGGPALATWIALFGGAAALLAGIFLPKRWSELDRAGALAAAAVALFVLPVAVHGFTSWDERPTRGRELTLGLVQALREEVPKGAVVFSDDETSYRIAAFAPVYVASALPGHVADTKANRPYERREDAREFFRTGDLAIPRRYGAGWIVVARERSRLRPDMAAAYEDERFALYRL